MKKIVKIAATCGILCALVFAGMLIADKQALSSNLLRLHVVANSNSDADQAVKLQVRDAVLQQLQEPMKDIANLQDAKSYIQSHKEELELAANMVLAQAGSQDRATITVCREPFSVRHYETFSLPSGVYESLRITIGEGEGKNWWCVAFPELCMQATGRDLRTSAASAGFSSHLTATITDEDYTISFFFLDCLGKLENFFHFM